LIRGKHLLIPPPVEHQTLVGVHEPRQLGRERRLPHPGLSGYERQDAVAGRCARPCLPQHAELLFPVDERPARRGLDPHQVGGIRVVLVVACLGFGIGRAAICWYGRQNLRGGGVPASCRHEQGAHRLGQAQRAGQQLGGVLVRGAVDASLQVTDRPRGQARCLGQLLLRQHGRGPQLPQQPGKQ
jgi:hypothetical protein